MDAAIEITNDLTGDLIYLAGDLETDSGLKSAIYISLFSDARDGNQNGWWGGETGSKLWTLKNAKRTAEVLKRAKDYAEEALEWLVFEKICKKVSVETSYDAKGRLLISVSLQKNDGKAQYDFLWRNSDAIL